MSNEVYEKYQLALIAQDYQRRGFDVSLGEQARIGNLRFDAVAKNKETKSLVVIELVNKTSSKAHPSERIMTIKKLSEIKPNAVVDLRYIDVELFRVRQWQDTVGEIFQTDINAALGQRVPRPPSNTISRSMHFMQIWALHATTIRAYGRYLGEKVSYDNSQGALDIYNELLHQEIIYRPEYLIDSVELNLFDLHEAVLAIAEGAAVNEKYHHDMTQHFLSIRKQIRQGIKNIQMQ